MRHSPLVWIITLFFAEVIVMERLGKKEWKQNGYEIHEQMAGEMIDMIERGEI